MRLFVSVALAGVLLVILRRYVDPELIIDLLRTAKLPYLFLAIISYGFVYFSRAIRLRQFEKLKQIPVWRLIPVVSLHGFFNFILPLRTGEATLVYLLKRYCRVVLGSGIGVLIVARIFDLSSLAICFAGGILFRSLAEGTFGDVRWVGSALLIGSVMIVLSLILGRLWKNVDRLLFRILHHCGWEEGRWGEVLLRVTSEVGNTLEDAKSLSFSVNMLFTSFMIWGGLFGTFWSLLRTIGINQFTLPEVIIGSTGAALTNALPVNAIGSLGTLELGWTAGFAFLGMSVNEGVASGFAIHAWVLLFAAFWAAISYVILSVYSSRASGRGEDLDP